MIEELNRFSWPSSICKQLDDEIKKWCPAFKKGNEQDEEEQNSTNENDNNNNLKKSNSDSIVGSKRKFPEERDSENESKNHVQSSSSTQATVNALPSDSVDEKPICQYGKDCYRKNPVHFQQFSHPFQKSKSEFKTKPQANAITTNEKKK